MHLSVWRLNKKMIELLAIILLFITGDYTNETYKATGWYEDDKQVSYILELREYIRD